MGSIVIGGVQSFLYEINVLVASSYYIGGDGGIIIKCIIIITLLKLSYYISLKFDSLFI